MNNLLTHGGGGGICSQVIIYKNGSLLPINWKVVHEAFNSAEELYLSVVENDEEISLLELEGKMVEEKLQLIGRDYSKNIAYILNESSKNIIILPNIFIGPAYKSLEKISDYLYCAEYENLNYGLAKDYYEKHAVALEFACTAVKSGNYFGRNFDWFYNHDVDFVVRTTAHGKRHATLGVAGSVPGLTKDFVESGNYSDKYDILPFFLLDGINDSGVFCNTNVVPLDKGDTTICKPSEEILEKIPSFMIPRYVLDNFSSALEAVEYIQKHVAVYIIHGTKDVGYDLHFMIGDSNHTYVCEIIENEFKYTENNIMTNFHIIGTEFNEDGTVYTPVTQDDDHNAMDTNKVTKHGSGLERYNIANANLNSANTKEGMVNLMHNLLNYNNSYTNADEDAWYTEFVGVYSTGDYTVKTQPSEYDKNVMPVVSKWFEDRDRSTNPQTVWHTTHTSIYDLENKKLSIYDSSEDDNVHEFNFKKYYNSEEIDQLIANLIK